MDIEQAIQDAIIVCNRLLSPLKPTYSEIALNHSTNAFTINRTTLSRRHHGKCTSYKEYISRSHVSSLIYKKKSLYNVSRDILHVQFI